MASETQRFISVIGAAEHNLKDINAEIPRNALTVITGISGSGIRRSTVVSPDVISVTASLGSDSFWRFQ